MACCGVCASIPGYRKSLPEGMARLWRTLNAIAQTASKHTRNIQNSSAENSQAEKDRIFNV